MAEMPSKEGMIANILESLKIHILWSRCLK